MYDVQKNLDTNAILNYYKTIVKPVLSYGSIIWIPHHALDLQKLESVQHRLFRYIAFKLGRPMGFDQHDYSEITREFKLWFIKSGHGYYDMMFIKKVNLIICEKIVSLFQERTVTYWSRD